MTTPTRQWVRDSLLDATRYRSGVDLWPGGEYIGDQWMDDGAVFVLCEDHDRHDWVVDWARSSICHTKQRVDFKTNPKYVYWYTTMNIYAGPKLTYDLLSHETAGVSHWTLVKLTDQPELDLSPADIIRGLVAILARTTIDAGDEEIDPIRIKQAIADVYQQLVTAWNGCGRHGVTWNVMLSLLEGDEEMQLDDAIAAAAAVCSHPASV